MACKLYERPTRMMNFTPAETLSASTDKDRNEIKENDSEGRMKEMEAREGNAIGLVSVWAAQWGLPKPREQGHQSGASRG